MAVWRAIGVGLVVFWTCVVPTASGEEQGPGPARSGMQANIDPQTGRFVPEPAGRPQVTVPQDLRPPLVAVTKPDGSLEVELDDRYQSRITATVGADGRVHLGCVTGDDAHDHAGE